MRNPYFFIGINMRIKFLILILFFVVLVASLGCIESKKLPAPNETKIIAPKPTLAPTEQKLPAYNETELLKINITFETWSRGYWSNSSYNEPYFRVITNYSEWVSFLDNQGYLAWQGGEGPLRLEGSIYPGIFTKPRQMKPSDFDNYSVIAAMMGRIGRAEGPEIEIRNITAADNIFNVIIAFKLGPGAAVESAPYHIIMIKKELLPKEPIFDFIDIEGKLLARVAESGYRSSPSLIDIISFEHPALRNYSDIEEIEEDYYLGDLKRGCIECEGKELDYIIRGYQKRWDGEESIVMTLQNAFTGTEKLKRIEIILEKETQVAFRTVAIGESSGYTNSIFIIINNRTEWTNVWMKHSSYLKTHKPEVPDVNFTNETAVAVFFGESPAFDAGLIDITKTGRTVFVKLQKKYPASRSSVQPYFIVRFSKPSDNITIRTLKWEYSSN